jgi:hypothetical protein
MTGFGNIIDKNTSAIVRLQRLVLALAIAVLLAVLSGCASMSTPMKNAQTGQTYTCSAWGWGWVGTPAAIIAHHHCVTTMESRGYVEMK